MELSNEVIELLRACIELFPQRHRDFAGVQGTCSSCGSLVQVWVAATLALEVSEGPQMVSGPVGRPWLRLRASPVHSSLGGNARRSAPEDDVWRATAWGQL